MKFILTCGGTAGHVNPALAIAGRLKELMPDSEFLFIGAEGKMEMELVPREGYEIKALKVTNMSRKKNFDGLKHNIESVKNVMASTKKAKAIIKEFKPDVVIGTGGYVCYPVLKAASALNIPTAIHESNAVPGLTTKMLAKSMDKIMLGFEESRRYYPNPEACTVTGTPVRGDFAMYTKNSAKAELGFSPDKPLVVSVWGSLGAGHMNEIIGKMLPKMKGQQDFNMIHSVGSMYYDGFIKKLSDQNLKGSDCNVDVRKYIYDMPRVMAAADLIMCRAGASTLSELCYMGKPVLIVPSPNVTNNHQEKNARVLEKAGGAEILLEGEFDEDTLYEKIKELLKNPEKLNSMSTAMASLAVPKASDEICDIILELARKKRNS